MAQDRPSPSDFSTPRRSKPTTLPSLIAWLSMGMLVAGWGPRFDPSLRELWIYVGLTGLISAVGLDALRRIRARSQRREQQKVILRRVKRELSRPSPEPPRQKSAPGTTADPPSAATGEHTAETVRSA